MPEMICPKFGLPCSSPDCSVINEPLRNAIARIKAHTTGDRRQNLVKAVLRRQLNLEASALEVNFHTDFTNDSAIICPSEVLEGDMQHKLGLVVLREAMRAIMQRCYDETVKDLS